MDITKAMAPSALKHQGSAQENTPDPKEELKLNLFTSESSIEQ